MNGVQLDLLLRYIDARIEASQPHKNEEDSHAFVDQIKWELYYNIGEKSATDKIT